MINLNSVILSGKEVLPIIEGGKGIGVSNWQSSGAFAFNNAVGTFSGVNGQRYDENGKVIPIIYKGKTRKQKHDELVSLGIEAGVQQAQMAYEASSGKGRIHMNILWEMGGAEKVLHGILQRAKGTIHGITCGAGMPYRLGEIADKYKVYYYPIVSSMRAFRALWKRAFEKTKDLLGGVVYEDPWKAGGHNGLSNSEDPNVPQDPYARVVEVRTFMNEVGLNNVPIIMAGGVWHIKDWEKWLNNKEIGPIAFQFGTRPIVTTESPVSSEWKQKLLTLKEGDVYLNNFSPTGFYSSAVENEFLRELKHRNERQIEYGQNASNIYNYEFEIGKRDRKIFIRIEDKQRAENYIKAGFTEIMRTPDSTVIFVSPEKYREILTDQINCMGCLSHCRFSNWKDRDDFTTGKKADPRSFCIQKTLQDIAAGGSIENNLMFSGHNAYRFATDPFYKNGNIPSVKQLIERIMTGY